MYFNGKLRSGGSGDHPQAEGGKSVRAELFTANPVLVPYPGYADKAGGSRGGAMYEILGLQVLLPEKLPFPRKLGGPVKVEAPVAEIENAVACAWL
jgi:hypothetical protein